MVGSITCKDCDDLYVLRDVKAGEVRYTLSRDHLCGLALRLSDPALCDPKRFSEALPHDCSNHFGNENQIAVAEEEWPVNSALWPAIVDKA